MTYRLATIGYGGFGAFAIRAYQAVPGVRVVALAGSHAERARAAAQKLGVPRWFDDYRRMLDEVDCDIVSILTPPHLHAEQFIACAQRGKHIVCDKPLALTRDRADAMLAAAHESPIAATVNHMMRYSPIYDRLRELVRSRRFGVMKHLSFNNHAGAKALTEDHWFWDESKSGGVLVEHGVHFFDILSYLMGEQPVPIATDLQSRGEVWSLVSCPKTPATADFFHHFDRDFVGEENFGVMVFERGVARFDGWIPMRLTVLGIDGTLERLAIEEDKEAHYADLLRRLLLDLIARIENPEHKIKVTLEDGRAAVDTAVRATALAR